MSQKDAVREENLTCRSEDSGPEGSQANPHQTAVESLVSCKMFFLENEKKNGERRAYKMQKIWERDNEEK